MYRRHLLTGLAATPLLLSGRRARAANAPLKIGVLNDMSGVYSAYQGPGSVIAALLAVEDFGGTVNGRRIEIVTGDHLNKPDVGATIARKWLDVDGIDVIMDVPNSAVAFAVAAICGDKNKAFIGSGAGSEDLTGPRCLPTTVHWTYDTWEAGHALGRAVTKQGGKKWFFLTADYTFGNILEKSVAEAVVAGGGQVVGSVRHPLGTADFSNFLVQAAASGADVLGLANAGDDNTTCIKQAAEFGLTKTMRIAGPVTNINAAAALGIASLGGVMIVTPFYWDNNEGTRAFSKRYAARQAQHSMPNDMQAGMYSATLAYLRAVRALGGKSDDGRAVVAQIKAKPEVDPVYGTSVTRADGRTLHPVYLMQAKTKAESKGKWDFFKTVSILTPEEAYRPIEQGHCPMIKS